MTIAKTTSAILHGRVMFAWLVRRGSQYYLVIKVASHAKTAHVRLSELGKRGAVIKRITLIIGTGKKELVKVPYTKTVHSVKVAVVS